MRGVLQHEQMAGWICGNFFPLKFHIYTSYVHFKKCMPLTGQEVIGSCIKFTFSYLLSSHSKHHEQKRWLSDPCVICQLDMFLSCCYLWKTGVTVKLS